MNYQALLFIHLAALAVIAVPASGASFRCELSDVKTLRSDGLLDPNPLADSYIKDLIVVDRTTGKVFHPGFGNDFFSERYVLDQGSSVSSFKVIAMSSLSPSRVESEARYRNTAYFQIETFAQGDAKPFIAISGVAIGMGLCR